MHHLLVLSIIGVYIALLFGVRQYYKERYTDDTGDDISE